MRAEGRKFHSAIITGHGRAKHIADLLFPVWSETFTHLYVVTPRNDPLTITLGQYRVGNSDYNGVGTMDRIQFAVSLAASMPAYQWVSLVEYDAIVWPDYNKAIGETRNGVVLAGQIFENADPKFTAPQYTHWPVTATAETWKRVLAYANGLLRTGAGFPDRWLAEGVHEAGLKYEQIPTAVFSANAIDTPELLAKALDARAKGAPCMHGIKTKAVFDALQAVNLTV